jgi:tetratricopeptide (TPR) repeat protein
MVSVSILMLAMLLIEPALGQQTASEWMDKGIALAEQGKYDEAIQVYDKAIEQDPTFAYPWNGKGLILSFQGKHDEAILALDEAIRRDPDYVQARNHKDTIWMTKVMGRQSA